MPNTWHRSFPGSRCLWHAFLDFGLGHLRHPRYMSCRARIGRLAYPASGFSNLRCPWHGAAVLLMKTLFVLTHVGNYSLASWAQFRSSHWCPRQHYCLDSRTARICGRNMHGSSDLQDKSVAYEGFRIVERIEYSTFYGQVGTAILTFVIAIHTFSLLFLRRKWPDWACYIILITSCTVLALDLHIKNFIIVNVDKKGPHYGLPGY